MADSQWKTQPHRSDGNDHRVADIVLAKLAA
jgi:hypothetical protein